jgi:nitrate/nitrite transport system substrate-binding protein
MAAAAALALVAGLVLSGCAASPPPTNPGDPTQVPLEEVTFGEVSPFQAANYLTLVAEQKGFFEENGIKAQFIGIAQNPLAPLIAGDVDMMTIGPNGMSALEQGQDIRFFAAFPPVVTFSLIVPKDSPIAEVAHEWPDVMEQLQGKSLGTTVPAALVDNIAKYLVTEAGLEPGDVAVTPAGDGASLVAGMVSGTFDSALVPSPLFEPLVASGDFVQVLDLWVGDVPGFVIPVATPAVTGAYAEENPDTVAGVQRALEEANAWAKNPDNREELQSLVANRLSVDPSTLDAPLETFLGALGDTVEYTPEQWEAGVAMLRQNGVLTKDYAYDEFVVPFSD